jgi:hypothetical protein
MHVKRKLSLVSALSDGDKTYFDCEACLWGITVESGEEGLELALAMILWRHRRLLISEGGEILKSHHSLIWDQGKIPQIAVLENAALPESENQKGLWEYISNPEVLDQCLELLTKLREGIEGDELRPDRDYPILIKVYGPAKWEPEGKRLFDRYTKWLELYELSEDMAQKKEIPSPEGCVDKTLQEIDSELERLKLVREKYKAVEVERKRIEMMRCRIPEGPELERLLRYENGLERAFDRAMANSNDCSEFALDNQSRPALRLPLGNKFRGKAATWQESRFDKEILLLEQNTRKSMSRERVGEISRNAVSKPVGIATDVISQRSRGAPLEPNFLM